MTPTNTFKPLERAGPAKAGCAQTQGQVQEPPVSRALTVQRNRTEDTADIISVLEQRLHVVLTPVPVSPDSSGSDKLVRPADGDALLVIQIDNTTDIARSNNERLQSIINRLAI
jgi:hypothetical protein